jgi:hypothetical protein
MSEFTNTPTAPSSSTTDDTSIKDKATNSMQAATRAGSDVAQTATDKAKEVAQETTRQARDLLGEAREQMHNQAGQQQQTLISNLRSVSEELGGMTVGGDQAGIAHDLVGRAGDHAHALAEWLDGRQPGELLDELRAFARRRPGTFLIGAMLAGVLAGRLTRGVVATHADGPPAQDTHPGPATHNPMTGNSGSDVAARPQSAEVGALEADVSRTPPGLGEASP